MKLLKKVVGEFVLVEYSKIICVCVLNQLKAAFLALGVCH